MNTFRFELVTPDLAHPVRDVTGIDVPATEGRLTVWAGHEPLVCALLAGHMTVTRPDGDRELWEVGQGALTVWRNAVTVLARSAVLRPDSERRPLSSP